MFQKKFLIVALFSLLSAGVMAADVAGPVAVRKPTSPLFDPVSWTGFYAGANGTYGFGGRSQFKASAASILNGDDGSKAQFSGQKGLGGGTQVGYDYQVNALVLGVAADFNFSAKGKTYMIDPTINGKLELRAPFEATLRARLGYALTPDLLAYVTGGAAATTHSFRYTDTDPTMIKGSKTHYGFVVGGGAEYRLTKEISAFAEYRASLFQAVSYATLNGTKVEYRHNEVRAGVNYRF